MDKKALPYTSKPVLVIYDGYAVTYASISAVSRATKVSRYKIIRALKRSDGFVPGAPFSVDFPLVPL